MMNWRPQMVVGALLLLGTLAYAARNPVRNDNPTADPDAMVTSSVASHPGAARFTMLTDRLVRMEYSSTGTFDDRATLAIVNRRLPVPKFAVDKSPEQLVIRTGALKVSYIPGSVFALETLSVVGTGADNSFTWSHGMLDSGNLRGTARSLDGITGGIDMNCSTTNIEYCAYGPLSRDGWAVIDDAGNNRVGFDGWILSNSTNNTRGNTYQDIYLFGYGHQFKEALGAYSLIAGSVPMPPRFVLGVWWSRYWPYTAEDLEAIARGYHEHNIPLDVLVSDMAWHYHGEKKIAWGGYSWGHELFPEPDTMLGDLNNWGINLTLNLHLNPIVPGVEDPSHYAQFATDLGLDPNSNITIPSPQATPYTGSVAELLVSSKRFAMAYLSLLDKMGTNFWWLDDEPKWVARILYEHSETRMEKGLAFSRWSGLGSHRYPIGFSGDTYMEWSSLAFQPSFTATAANVQFWWSHDIGGHRSTIDPSLPRGHTDAAYDPELYLRWLQWGAHAPILRTHPQPDPAVERRAWGYKLPYSEYMRDAFARRARLVPAIFTGLHKLSLTGVSALHPVYYEAPTLPEAYTYNDTYIFCDNFLVAPVTSQISNLTHLAQRSVWLPPGSWVDTISGVEIESKGEGITLTRNYTLWEIPVFARSGSMVPLAPPPGLTDSWVGNGFGKAAADFQPALGSARNNPDVLSWEIWAGSNTSGAGTVYEEFGDFHAVTNASYVITATSMRITISADRSDSRKHRFEIQQVPPATSLSACDASTEVNWQDKSYYNGRTMVQNVYITTHSGTACVEVTFGAAINSQSVSELRQVPYKQIRKRLYVVKQWFDDEHPQPTQPLMGVVDATNTGTVLNAHCQLNMTDAHETWMSMMSAIVGKAGTAVAAIGTTHSPWNATMPCPEGEICYNLPNISSAWVCGVTHESGFMVPMCN